MNFDHDDRQKLEQLVQDSRWNEVTNARERVVNRFEAIDRMQFEGRGSLTSEECALLTQRAVQLYVRQVETLLNPVPSHGEKTKYWDGELIGEFQIPTGNIVRVVGLKQYKNLDEQIPYVTTEQQVPHGGALPEMRQVERTITPPMTIHKDAFSATNRALADKGMEFDPRDKNQTSNDVEDSDPGVEASKVR